MLRLLSQYSRQRFAWLLLFLSSLVFELIALYFQHGLGLAPCTLCIYQRCAILGILFASLIALINPKNIVLRVMAILLWLYSAIQGFQLAHFQAKLQFAPTLFDTCSINVDFPSWLPLNSWLPNLFNAYGSCADKSWSFLTIEMSQWMVIIFSCYILVALLVVIAQFISPKKRTLWDK